MEPTFRKLRRCCLFIEFASFLCHHPPQYYFGGFCFCQIPLKEPLLLCHHSLKLQIGASISTMKGFCKGFNKYISNMFVTPKEPEMQIGGPTDVKHVAHIGWDGGSASAAPPTWMGEFKTGPEFSAPAVPAGSGTRGVDAKVAEEGAETTGREGHHKKHRRKKGKGHREKKGKSKQTNGGQTSNQPD